MQVKYLSTKGFLWFFVMVKILQGNDASIWNIYLKLMMKMIFWYRVGRGAISSSFNYGSTYKAPMSPREFADSQHSLKT